MPLQKWRKNMSDQQGRREKVQEITEKVNADDAEENPIYSVSSVVKIKQDGYMSPQVRGVQRLVFGRRPRRIAGAGFNQ